MQARLCLYFKDNLWKDYPLGNYESLEDFVNTNLPLADEVNYSNFKIKFYNVPIYLRRHLDMDSLSLKDFLESHELDAIFDWSNFVAQNEEDENSLEEATLNYTYLFHKWDRDDFNERYVGKFDNPRDFGRYYIKENYLGYEELLGYFSYEILGQKLYDYYHLNTYTFKSLSRYRQALNLPPNGYDYEERNGGFIGDYEDYEDFEYKEDEKKEKQFQDFIKRNQWKVDLADKAFFAIGKIYINNNYDGDIDKFLDDPDCPWELEELINMYRFAYKILDSDEYLYEVSSGSSGIFVFLN